MFAQPKTERSHQPQIDPHIKQWLKQRQDILVLYSQLCEANPVELERLDLFCQTLVDYLSMGHFKIYEKVAEIYETYHQQTLDPILLDKISTTTDIALAFNEKYSDPLELEPLLQDLSYLGEHLADRMDWEDTILKPYLESFRQTH